MTIRHPAYPEEQKRLERTVQVVDQEIKLLREDVREATDDDVKQIINQKKAKELVYLETAREKPYFGRVDFSRAETGEHDTVYIGKRGIVDSTSLDAVVIDWRAPIASLFYSGESTDACYRTPKELVRGEVTLKRNFAIEQGVITGIYDGALKETIQKEIGSPDDFLGEGFIDEFLASSLNQTNDSRLKDIVATIQSEQNEIIRAEKDRPVIVQGVAGSGKTTIALHRLSYLIYNYQDTLSSKKFMVFAPNRLFLNYISEVLPELGVEDVQQSTFLEWASREIKTEVPKGWRMIDPGRTLRLFFEHSAEQERERDITRNRLRFKGSLAMRDTLDCYVGYLIDEVIPFRPVRFLYKKTERVFSVSGADIRELFTEQYGSLPLAERVVMLRKHLKQQLTKQFYAHIRELKMDLDKQALLRFEAKLEQMIDAYFKDWPSFEVFAAYRELLTDPRKLRKLVPDYIQDEVIGDVSQSCRLLFEQERLEAEDVAPLLYLKHLLHGSKKQLTFDHAVIDEAQDLSALEILLIAQMTKRQSVTVVGDLAQAIHSYRGLEDWRELLEGVFTDDRAAFYTLQQSYRSTVEIMRLASRVLSAVELPGITPVQPVLRHGKEPLIVPVGKPSEMYQDLANRVREYLEAGYSSIAIVGQTVDASRRAAKAVRPLLPQVVLLTAKDTAYPGGVTILPAYLTKGLQFDVVLLLDVDEDQYPLDREAAKLLYVAMTRPVHHLVIYHMQGKLSSLLATDRAEKKEMTG
ncbi:AAA family ATPase [Brevibacillus humidisoli]|uniref:HelD family protein n=1 Tax=Brevibacillus humidisoli TaxID=2895522 RepID=UPI001E658F70|nr:UvrD-helicase domain-containing protein [Brevibacillus humidisoli]UFJ42258.1 AAA family ATPase [Brevibacillus humidisoli]